MPATALATPRLPPGSLRTLLAERFPDAVVLPERRIPAFPTGVPGLDKILPNGGLPRGRITVWQSVTGGGTAVLRAAVAASQRRGERIAWIDGARSIGPQWHEGPMVIRPSSLQLARKAAEILLRSGGFGLVVLSGAPLDSAAMLRLSRMTHEGGGAFVALADAHHTAMLRIVSRYLPHEISALASPFGDPALIERIAIRIEVRSPGWHAHTLLRLPVRSYDLRLSLTPGLADRRGDLD